LDRGHAGPCECDCCDCPEGRHNGSEAPTLVDDDGCLCVGKPPYYGTDTRFYGEDVEARGLKALESGD
jgi:hypothetical protein